jgi:hypothetical protein
MIPCALTASVIGDPAPLYELINSVAGPGCVIWPDVDPRASIETTIGLLLRGGARGGARSYEEARKIATALAERAAERIERGQRRAEIDKFGCPFDLQAIVPIPREVLLAGLEAGGREWMRNLWGVDAPLVQVELQIRSKIVLPKRGRGRPRAGDTARAWTKTSARWTFLSDRFPFPVFRKLLQKWPQIEFRVEFEDEFGPFDRTYPSLDEAAAKAAA